MSDTYYAIGDIHGCYDHMMRALAWIEDQGKSKDVIFIGDYIDRGPNNAKVLDWVMNPPEDWNVVTLMGNHELMFFAAFERYCGYYDRKAMSEIRYKMNFIKVLDWMKQLPIYHIVDENVFAHADFTGEPIDQSYLGLFLHDAHLWNRYNLGEDYTKTNYFLTHGHTPRTMLEYAPNRINIDTGAVFNGTLTVAEYKRNVRGPVAAYMFSLDKDAPDKVY